MTEHQLVELECGGCGARTRGEAPEAVAAPVQYGPRLAAIGVYLWHGQFLSGDRACQALSDLFGCAPSSGALQSMARKAAGLVAPAVEAITKALVKAEVAHFDETGFRAAGKLAWVHSASSGKLVLVTVHAKRGKEGMMAAGVLPSFGGSACHDVWRPYDSFTGVAGHALCGPHLLRELAAVTEVLDRACAPSPEPGHSAPSAPTSPPPLATAPDGPEHSPKPSTATPGSPGTALASPQLHGLQDLARA